MNTCTWVGCSVEATKDQVGQDGCLWASLCDVHAEELDRALTNPDVRVVLSSWVKAQGGAKAAADRM